MLEATTSETNSRVIDCAISNTRVLKVLAGGRGDNRALIVIKCDKCPNTGTIHGKSFWNVPSVADRFRKKGWEIDGDGRAARCPTCKNPKRTAVSVEPLVVSAAQPKTKPPTEPKQRRTMPPAAPATPVRSTTWETVTPEMALEYLATRDGKPQRPLRAVDVRKYSADMKAGRWLENGESLIFDTNGELVDGQHRLHAQLDAGVTMQWVVVRGVAPEVFQTIDRGKNRTAAHLLDIAGLGPDSTMIAAVSAALDRIEDGFMFGVFSDTRMASEAVLTYAMEHKDEHALIRTYGNRVKKARLASPSSIVASITFLRRLVEDCDRLDAFFHRVVTGVHLDPNEIAYHLRNKLLGQRARGDVDRFDMMGYCIQGWGLHLRGISRGLILRQTDGALNMPVVWVSSTLCAHPEGGRVHPSTISEFYNRKEAK